MPKDLTIGQFIFVIRKRIKLNAEQSLFLIINDNMPPTNDLIINIYERNKDEDGFLYVTYCGENTFG